MKSSEKVLHYRSPFFLYLVYRWNIRMTRDQIRRNCVGRTVSALFSLDIHQWWISKG